MDQWELKQESNTFMFPNVPSNCRENMCFLYEAPDKHTRHLLERLHHNKTQDHKACTLPLMPNYQSVHRCRFGKAHQDHCPVTNRLIVEYIMGLSLCKLHQGNHIPTKMKFLCFP